ncbi:MAG: GAF domain-containing protein [Planctomycetota bacterium]|nr:GAF domain-containing protein [Planctomycetota bacterium]
MITDSKSIVLLLGYQQKLLAARSVHDVLDALFQTFARCTGPLFGAAFLLDDRCRMPLVGRFGIPQPDSACFCRALSAPVVEWTLRQGRCLLLDAGQEAGLFDRSIHRFLPGLTILSIPLLPDDPMGVILLYRKGEQPVTDADLALAEMMSTPTAVAIERNE